MHDTHTYNCDALSCVVLVHFMLTVQDVFTYVLEL